MPNYVPPPSSSGIRRRLWQWWLLFEASTALSMCETWEKVLVLSAFLFVTLLFWLSVFTYYPGHLAYLSRRFSYYIFEDESVDVRAMIKDWIWGHLRLGGSDAGAKVEL